ncbi:molybdopterin converting factor, small subunit [Halalkaliarchaeum desulfuricum]|uniref:Molybdopterin converting factor, small subunit n=1 Tax=Halalkaliarchaeum desulfuricum TaxID=2055893 RepID=A0A343TLM8_9EURY|nr:MoaD/ThiS family protein [Halalkaliarchaeum desulfuricum]AUX10000.1 molybdopterin converting factor, small subunit [Halalkaliarchaeum desulfuricum]
MTGQHSQPTGSVQDTQPAEDERAETTVEVRCTGHVRMELGHHSFEYSFQGTTLREFLEEFFAEYPEIESMIIATREEDATARGWAPVKDPPGTWRKNPEGEQTVAFARVMVNGRFNENLDGFDTELSDGDRVALVYPFMFCL